MFSTGFLPDAKEIPDWYARTPEGREMLAAQAAELLQRRHALEAEIAELEQRAKDELPPLQDAEQAARQRIADARAAYQTALNDHAAAHAAVWRASSHFQTEIDGRKSILFREADPAIDRFLSRLRDLYSRLRQVEPPAAAHVERTSLNPVGHLAAVLSAQAKACAPINSLFSIVRAGIDRANALKFSAVADVPAAMAAIEREIREAAEAAAVALPGF